MLNETTGSEPASATCYTSSSGPGAVKFDRTSGVWQACPNVVGLGARTGRTANHHTELQLFKLGPVIPHSWPAAHGPSPVAYTPITCLPCPLRWQAFKEHSDRAQAALRADVSRLGSGLEAARTALDAKAGVAEVSAALAQKADVAEVDDKLRDKVGVGVMGWRPGAGKGTGAWGSSTAYGMSCAGAGGNGKGCGRQSAG